jgi:hypothetical protein
LGWTGPFGRDLMLFRVSVKYSVVLIVGLILWISAPYCKQLDPRVAALPMLIWLATGCFVSGLACAAYTIVSLRRARRFKLAWVYLFAIVFMLIKAIPAFAFVGLVDVWFDLRRASFRKGET